MEHFEEKNYYTLEVQIVTAEQVKQFVNAAEQMKGELSISSQDNYVVPGRSLIGIFSLDLSKPVTITCDDTNYKEVFDICEKIGIAD